MPKTKFEHVQISSIATAVPIHSRSIEDETDLLGNGKKINKIKKITSLSERRIANVNTTSIDLCCYAARKLIKEMKIDTNEFDGVIFVTQTPDYRIPNCASIVHGELGLNKDCLCYDVNHGCSGYIYGLLNAFSLVESNMCKKVLLLVGDTLSKVINPKDKSLVIIHGDAGSATIIERSEQVLESKFIFSSYGDKAKSIIVEAGGFKNMSSVSTKIEKEDEEGNVRSDEELYMDGLAVFNFAIQNVPQIVNDLVDYSQCNIKDIDFFAFHQANGIINKGINNKLNIDEEKAPIEVITKYGNTSCCSIPNVLSEAFGNNNLPNDRVIMTGFGVGLSLAACYTSLKNTKVFPVIDYNDR